MTVGLLYLTTLIVIVGNRKNEEFNFVSYCIMMFLIMFGIFFSYYFFVPVVYSSFGIYMLIDMIRKRKKKNFLSIFEKKNVIEVIVILIIPTILGFMYFVLPGLLENGETSLNAIAWEGYIYRNLYSNFVLLGGMVIFYVLYNIKSRKNSFSSIFIIISGLFALYLLKKGLHGEVSSYYFYKMHFLFWIIIFYINVKALFVFIEEKNSVYVISYLSVFVGIIVYALSGYDGNISERNILFNPDSGINSYANVYLFNKSKIDGEGICYTTHQLDIIKSILNNSKDKSTIKIVGNGLQMLWANSLWKITDTTDVVELQKEEEVDIDTWLLNSKKKFLITLKKFDRDNENKEMYNELYDESDIVVLEKK